MDLSYEAMTNIITEVDGVFPSPYFHFGGDEVDKDCYDQRPAIK